MKKRIVYSLLLCILFAFSADAVFAINLNESEAIQARSKAVQYIRSVYDQIRFPKNGKLKFEAFRYAMTGYLNLQEAGRIRSGATLSVCDFTLSSNQKRFWVIDVQSKKILFHTLVAHGMGTGEEFARNFSNVHDSHQSSLGFFVTGDTYSGNNGYSLKLHGVDGIYNDQAYDRAIVIHGADYVSDAFAKANQRLGRSHGCPALPVELAPKIIDRIQSGNCLFIYHSSESYLKNSYWLRNRIQQLPREADLLELNLKQAKESESLPKLVRDASDKENTPEAETKPEALKKPQTDEFSKEKFLNQHVSAGNQKNFKVYVKTVIIKKAPEQVIPAPKVSRVVYIQEKPTGNDTLIVR